MRLNPAKCAFGVTSGKLLGYVISSRGIEIDPTKIKAIMSMPPPKIDKLIRGFIGRLQYISWFISNMRADIQVAKKGRTYIVGRRVSNNL